MSLVMMRRSVARGGRWLLPLGVAFLTSCASSPKVESSRFGVYSTAYLGENHEIVYDATKAAKEAPKSRPKVEWSWSGDGVLGKPSIVIDLGQQRATFLKNGNEVGRSSVSTGREGFKTPSGSFQIIDKNSNHVSSLYGDYINADGEVVVANVDVTKDKCPAGAKFRGSPMPFFMRVHGGVGMHAGYLPGYPASHGCIRMPRAAAQRFFENAPPGTPVRIVN
jgi:hypothetical protein